MWSAARAEPPVQQPEPPVHEPEPPVHEPEPPVSAGGEGIGEGNCAVPLRRTPAR